jgi:GUN4-like
MSKPKSTRIRKTGQLIEAARQRLWAAIRKTLESKVDREIDALDVRDFVEVSEKRGKGVSYDLICDFLSASPTTDREFSKAKILFNCFDVSLTESADDWIPKTPTAQAPPDPTAILKDKNSTQIIDAVPLELDKEVDYRNLRDLLMNGKWREADKETLTLMLKAANRESQGWLDSDNLKKFPCKDLKTIDRLWVIASNGHFGISVQTKIWVASGSPIAYSDDWKMF